MQFLITTAGLNAALNANLAGLSLSLTHIAVGSGAWTPTAAASALVQELERVPVAGGEVNGNVLHITGLLDSADGYWIREAGIFQADGTLFAVWSGNGEVGWYKNPAGGTDGRLVAFDLVLEAVPADTIVITPAGDCNVSLAMAESFAKFAIAQVDTFSRQISIARALGNGCTGRTGLTGGGGSSVIINTGEIYYAPCVGDSGTVNMPIVGIDNGYLIAQIYEQGTTNNQIIADIDISNNGVIVWSTDNPINGYMVIYGSASPRTVS